jgi:CRP/FNR family transcriptional regulator, cyclic AMP receptor protein
MEHDPIDWGGVQTRRVQYPKGKSIFSQGDDCTTILYVEQGSVRLSVVSHAGKEAVVAVLGPGYFFGEGCLAGQPRRIATATAVTPCTVVEVDKLEMSRKMRANPPLAERFLFHMLTRNIRIEEDLIDHLFNDAEKRLARTLLLMARYGEEEPAHRTLPRVSQTILAEMIGSTRSRVNAFMNKFRKLGFIDYNGTLKVNNSLLTVLLRDAPASESGAASPPASLRPETRLPRTRSTGT